MRIACAIVALCLALSSPAAAQVGNGLTLGQPQTQSDAAPPPAQTTTDGGGLQGWQEALIFAAGLVLILGIAFAILGDARDKARSIDGQPAGAGADPRAEADRHAQSQQAKRRAREKARRARAARKRNR